MNYSDGMDAVVGFFEAPVRDPSWRLAVERFDGEAEDKLNRAYLKISVQNAIGAMERTYSVLEDARKIAKAKFGVLTGNKPWEMQQGLGADQTLANKMSQVAAFAADLRKQDRSRAVTPAEWERTRNFMRMAASEWSGVNEGRAFQMAVFDAFLNEVKEGMKSPITTSLVNVTGWNLPGWAWWLGGSAILGGLAYAGYKVFIVAAPVATQMMVLRREMKG